MRGSLMKLCGAGVFLGILVLNAGSVAAQTRRTVWDGVFTAEQAERGKVIFMKTCAVCHGADLTGVNRPPLKGDQFLNHWMEDTLDVLFSRLKSMPPGRDDSEEIAYVDVLAFLLNANAFPAGAQELNEETLPQIHVQSSKEGPAPVPNFTLVDVVGCFVSGPRDTWMLNNGSEPARTRSPGQPTESEIAAARAKPLGSHTLQLLDVKFFSSAFRPEAHADHKVNVKGFLIRTGADVRINVTWVEMLAADCGR